MPSPPINESSYGLLPTLKISENETGVLIMAKDTKMFWRKISRELIQTREKVPAG